ncbi:MAG TPA: hypothetical protein P5268_02935 [Candidatus Marinimicrobia bacterium]|nr:hypothetical protein [Candidatus Neomarinimicrobiota bacterium]HRS52183.1 hypothetical protein [Candidatus Neomarinimicrobiota bacterium]HRU91974.1 hypothetical protein [Candidatus Neomarinimicrobiota bacterium]
MLRHLPISQNVKLISGNYVLSQPISDPQADKKPISDSQAGLNWFWCVFPDSIVDKTNLALLRFAENWFR